MSRISHDLTMLYRKLILLLLFILQLNIVFGNNGNVQFDANLARLIENETLVIDVSKALTKNEQILISLSKKENVSYSELLQIVQYLCSSRQFKTSDLSNFIKLFVRPPTSTKYVELDFVRINWWQISEYRDENQLKKANVQQAKLTQYLNTIQVNNLNLKKARIYEQTHDVILKLIKKDIKGGLEACKKMSKDATDLKDTSLMIQAMNLTCEFYVYEGKLDEFIELSEKSMRLDTQQAVKSEYYFSTIMHLLDAYTYSGNNHRSLELLHILYNNPDSRNESYNYYTKFLANIDVNDPIKDSIFSIVGAKDMVDFYTKTNDLTKSTLDPNSYYHFLRESATTLAHFGYTSEALEVMEIANNQNKMIYTNELAEALADRKNSLLEQRKNLEITYANKIANLYLIALSIIGLLLVILIILLFRKVHQNKSLRNKNIIIQERENEKALLMKELHHRVKNNFQITSSLLAIQAKNIKNEKMKSVLTETQSRINSMALNHEKLYNKENLKYSLQDYLLSLHKDSSEIFKINTSKMHFQIESPIELDVNMAIPLGLIFNELITNSLKHVNEKELNIYIDVESLQSSIKIQYRDSGPGLKSDELFENSTSMGLRLIKRLTRQMQGSVKFVKNCYYFDLPYDN